MTMRELAKLANVSVSTVSKAFYDADDVSYETKQHIFDIAKKNGCYGKYYKGKYAKKIIAIICPELGSNFYSTFVEQLQKIIEANNCIPIVSADHFEKNIQAELIEYYASYLKVDGIIVLGLSVPIKKGYDTPIVALFSSVDTSVDTVNSDVDSVIYDAVHLLSDYGHKKIAFIGEKLTVTRADIFKKAMQSLNEMEETVFQSDYRFEEAGEDCIRQLLEKGTNCTAIVCAYDNMAFGAMKELQKHGLRVPQDYSIIGIDNIHVSEYLETPLTSIGIDYKEVCMIAWDLLAKKLENYFYRSSQKILLRGNLFLRESISAPKSET